MRRKVAIRFPIEQTPVRTFQLHPPPPKKKKNPKYHRTVKDITVILLILRRVSVMLHASSKARWMSLLRLL